MSAIQWPTTRVVLLSLFAVSLLVRAAFLLLATGLDYPLEMDGDAAGYHHVAASFLRGDGWVDDAGRESYLPPLLPFQLLLAYVLTGPEPVVARWTMVLFSSLVAPVLFLAARRLLDGRSGIALMATVAWVLYPPAVYYAGRPLTETTAALLTVSGLWAFLWAARSGGVWPALVTGALWALAALNRPVFLLLPLALLAAQVALSRFGALDWSWPPRRWALGIAAFLVVMMPWTVRNYVEHGVFMPTTSSTGSNLLITNGNLSHPDIQAGKYHYQNPDHLNLLEQTETEVEWDAVSRRLALDEIKENWRLLPRPIFNRAKNFWTPRPDPYDPSWTFNDSIMLVVWVPVLVFFLMSSFTRSWRQSWPALTVVLYAFLLTMAFWGTPRFRFPVDPIIIVCAAVGFSEAWRFLSSAMRRRLQ
jgi:hypothetical protein